MNLRAALMLVWRLENYNVIYALAAQGVAVLFASSDLPEVLRHCPTGLW